MTAEPTPVVLTCDPRAIDGSTNPLQPDDMIYIYKYNPFLEERTAYVPRVELTPEELSHIRNKVTAEL